MKSEEQNIMENSIMEELKNRIIKLEKELEFEKEKSRRMMWIFGMVGGAAFIEKDKENK
jgi:hypothetical protein